MFSRTFVSSLRHHVGCFPLWAGQSISAAAASAYTAQSTAFPPPPPSADWGLLASDHFGPLASFCDGDTRRDECLLWITNFLVPSRSSVSSSKLQQSASRCYGNEIVRFKLQKSKMYLFYSTKTKCYLILVNYVQNCHGDAFYKASALWACARWKLKPAHFNAKTPVTKSKTNSSGMDTAYSCFGLGFKKVCKIEWEISYGYKIKWAYNVGRCKVR